VTNVQVLTIAIALATSFLAVLAGVLLNNTRLNDVRDSLSGRLDDLKDVMAARVETRAAAKDLQELRVASSKDLQELRVLIEKNHSEMLLKIVDIDNRLNRIESERRIVS